MFESALTTITFSFIDHHEYFEFGPAHPRAQMVSAYDGQVEFIATPKSMMDFNIQTIYAEVRELAAAFETVRSFAYIETKGFPAPRFRAEFFSVKSADEVVAVSSKHDAVYISVSTFYACIVFRAETYDLSDANKDLTHDFLILSVTFHKGLARLFACI
jgi:hypothetical protein